MRITRARTVRRLKVRAVILAIVVATVARAQAPITTPIRLGEIYAQVQRANPKLAAARALVRAARARTPAASRLPDPQLQLGFMNYSLPSLSPMPPLGMTQLQLMQMVPLGGKLRAGRPNRRRAGRCDKRARRRSRLGPAQPDCGRVLRPLRHRPAAWRRTRDGDVAPGNRPHGGIHVPRR